MTANHAHIGTAGWSISSRHAYLFPAQGTHLQRYAAAFNAAEINSSFYRPHMMNTYQRWAESVPADFRFSVKAPKQVTHQLRLVDCAGLLEDFAGQIHGLGEKLGVVLVQLPPSLAFDEGLAGRFFDDLRAAVRCRIACEPRHVSWFSSTADALLAGHGVARVAADPPITEAGDRPGGFDGLAYWRLHGSPRMYYSAYDDTRLQTLARTMRAGLAAGRQVWCVFDNTAGQAAASDAAKLKGLGLDRGGPEG